MIAIDTNLLVYAHRGGTPEHSKARKAIERAAAAASGWGVSAPCVAEFWSVVTHPSTPRASKPAQASAFFAALIHDAGCEIWTPTAEAMQHVLRIATAMDVRGARIFDLLIATIAQNHGATEIWSHDAGFVTLPGLSLVDPLR